MKVYSKFIDVLRKEIFEISLNGGEATGSARFTVTGSNPGKYKY